MDKFLELNIEFIFVELSFEVGKECAPVWVVSFHEFLYFGLDLFEGLVFGRLFGVFVDLVEEEVLVEGVFELFEGEVFGFIEVEVSGYFL